MSHKIEAPYYPIVYVRGYAMTKAEKEETFHDAYYGFAATSVEKRQGPPEPGEYLKADIFEGQLIKFMKNYGYTDSYNGSLQKHFNPSRGIWVCRFYDEDYLQGKNRHIIDHAKELAQLIKKIIPAQLKKCGVNLGKDLEQYKVILIAHSMGGLVCRTLIQNKDILNDDPNRYIHKFVTMGTPHKGIDLGLVPDSLEQWVAKNLNPYGSGIFQDDAMRKYLYLDRKYELNSLGDTDFPVSKCFCLIGSDYKSYSAAKHLTGSHSDGLVKQSHAYMVSGEKPKTSDYLPENVSFSANVHRAHSGYRGIVNSYESYENIQRFLFGNVKAEIWLTEVQPTYPTMEGKDQYFYDLEFQLSIRGTNTYLHTRKQDPCENAMRYHHGEIPDKILLHRTFLDSKLISDEGKYLHFLVTIKLAEYHLKKGWLWDKEYPGRTIYSESIEIRAADIDINSPGYELQYRWFSDSAPNDDWMDAQKEDDGSTFIFDLREAKRLKGTVCIKTEMWK